MHVDAAVERIEVAAEDFAGQAFAFNDHAGRGQENLQEVEFDRGEIDFIILAEGGARRGTDFEVAETKSLFGRGCSVAGGRTGAAKNGLDARREFPRVKGFREVVVGANFETQDAIDVLAASGEHDNGHAGMGADVLEDFEAAKSGEHDVEDDEGIFPGEGLFDAERSAVEHVDAKAFGLEIFDKEFAEFDVVVDDEQSATGRVEHGSNFFHGRGTSICEFENKRPLR